MKDISEKDKKMSYVSLRHINKVYPDGVHAVHDFNLEIDKHDFVVLVGPSGCGKTTLLRMIAGLEDITAGSFYIDGTFANNTETKDRNIAMVFQSYALYPNMTVYDNIAFGLKMRKVDKATIDQKVRNIAKMLLLDDYLFKKPGQLSGGQKQRVALGRAIIRDARLFLMDEPLSNLDAKLRVQTRADIVRLHEQLGETTIYVTHDQTEAMTMATKIVCMSKGHIQQIGTPIQIYEHPSNKFVATFIGSPSMNILPSVCEHGIVKVCNNLAFSLTEEEKNKVGEFYNKRIAELTKQLGKLDETISILPHAIDLTEREERIQDSKKEKLLKKGIRKYYKSINKKTNKIKTIAAARQALYQIRVEKILGIKDDDSLDKKIIQMAKQISADIDARSEKRKPTIYARTLKKEYWAEYRDGLRKIKTTAKIAAEEDLKRKTGTSLFMENAVMKDLLKGEDINNLPLLLKAVHKLNANDHYTKKELAGLSKVALKDLLRLELSRIDIKVASMIEADKNGIKGVPLTEDERSRMLANQIISDSIAKGVRGNMKFGQRLASWNLKGNLKTRAELKEELTKSIKTAVAKYKKYLSDDVIPLSFGIRPENMSLSKFASIYERPSEPLELDISIAELLGSEYILHAQYNGADLVAKIPLSAEIRNHSKTEVVINLAAGHLFDDISGICIF